MPKAVVKVGVDVQRTARVLQLEGLFDVAPTQRSERTWEVNLPIEEQPWSIGLIVGPSGSGKSTIARQLFPGHIDREFQWSPSQSVVDGFPAGMSIKDITGLLSSVGFSSPPSWLRPYHVLSNGEKFRCHLARLLADESQLIVLDEYSSVVDRTVAQIGSAAVAKAVRRTPGKRFVAVTCHHDVEEWLCPDWVVEMPAGTFARRSLRRRPPIELEVRRVEKDAWHLFKHHHYLDTSLHVAAKCFVALWRNRPVAFASVLYAPHGNGGWWREHRTVCLPDFQGVGIGNALSEFVGGVMKATGKRYMSTTGNPAMIRHRAKSKMWLMRRAPSRSSRDVGQLAVRRRGCADTRATNRLVAGFEYLGPALPVDAKRLGVV